MRCTILWYFALSVICLLSASSAQQSYKVQSTRSLLRDYPHGASEAHEGAANAEFATDAGLEIPSDLEARMQVLPSGCAVLC